MALTVLPLRKAGRVGVGYFSESKYRQQNALTNVVFLIGSRLLLVMPLVKAQGWSMARYRAGNVRRQALIYYYRKILYAPFVIPAKAGISV